MLLSLVSRLVFKNVPLKRAKRAEPERLSSRFILLQLLIILFAGTVHAQQNSAAINNSDPAWLVEPMTLHDARHLLVRTGFGATPARVAELLPLSRAEAVDNVISGLKATPDVPMPSWVDQPAPHFWTRSGMPQAQRQAFDQARDREVVELRRWWINNMLRTTSPQTERLVLFWHDHFATSYHGVDRRSISIARQNQLFRSNATASYREFLKLLIRDPAMLRYLDNTSNRKGKPNENLARELLELFTLGEGNYTESTVKEAARALTGNSVSQTRDETFQFQEYKHDFNEKTLFGQTGNFDGDALIDIILEQPAAATYLVERYWHAFVSDTPPSDGFQDSFVTNIAEQFRDSDYDLSQLYRFVLRSKAFWHEQHRLSLVKSPATLLIGTARSLDFPKRAWSQLPGLHALLGMDLFAPQNVAGWSEGDAFIAPGRLLNRQLALETIISASAKASSSTLDMTSSSDMQDNDMSNNGMMISAAEPEGMAQLQARVAGHLFKGAPLYKVLLRDSYNQVLWTSDVRKIDVGYDTEMFGEMRNREQLAWQTVQYDVTEELLSASKWVQVEFLNDAAGKKGDRNLFVESVSVLGNQFSSRGAKQVSDCPPNNAAGAGNLYCAGHVLIDVTPKVHVGLARSEPYTARNASVLWSSQNKQRINTIVTLEHVQTPDQNLHTLSFQLVSKNKDHLELWLDNYGCSTDCIQAWPNCADTSDHSDMKRLILPLVMAKNKNLNAYQQCHYDALSQSERSLVNTIFSSLPTLLEHFSENEHVGKPRFKSILNQWKKRIPAFSARMEFNHNLKATTPFVLDSNFEQPVTTQRQLYDPTIEFQSLEAYESMLDSAGVSLAQMLIGGVPVTQFPRLQSLSTESARIQLEAVLKHPVYQVY